MHTFLAGVSGSVSSTLLRAFVSLLGVYMYFGILTHNSFVTLGYVISHTNNNYAHAACLVLFLSYLDYVPLSYAVVDILYNTPDAESWML